MRGMMEIEHVVFKQKRPQSRYLQRPYVVGKKRKQTEQPHSASLSLLSLYFLIEKVQNHHKQT